MRTVSFLVFALVLPACPSDPKTPRPAELDPSALGGRPGQPLVVDWKAADRGDLEVAMREGVAVFAYGPLEMRLLKDCHIEGSYGFVGITTKEQVIRLESADEIRVNLPLSGLGLAATLGAESARDSVLDVAVILVGKRKTTWQGATRADLRGNCDGATHFVRGASVGAFAIDAGARGRVRVAAEVFGLGIGHGAVSSSKVRNTDGNPVACKDASPEAEAPPKQCGAPVRLELTALNPEVVPVEPADSGVVISAGCPGGFVLAEGKCGPRAASRSFVCNPADFGECQAQCSQGNAPSCVNLGVAFERGLGVGKDLSESARHYRKACEAGEAVGCHNLGFLLSEGLGGRRDEREAAVLFQRACADGEARACNSLGAAFFRGAGVPRDGIRAQALFSVACNGGLAQACTNLGALRLTGEGSRRAPVEAARLFSRACDGGDATGCSSLAASYETGNGLGKNLPKAIALYQRACRGGAGLGCFGLGTLVFLGHGVARDEARARELFVDACKHHEAVGCAAVQVLYRIPQEVRRSDVQVYADTWAKTCLAGEASDCSNLGLLYLAVGEESRGRDLVAKGCSGGDAFGCALKAR